MQFWSDSISNACKINYVGVCNKESAIKMAEQYILSQFNISYDEKTGNIEIDYTGGVVLQHLITKFTFELV